MNTLNEINISHIGTQVLYKLTQEESIKNNNQIFAPAIIVAGWLNEYLQEKEPELRVGLNLKVITDGEHNLHKLSVKRGNREYPAKCNPHSIPDIDEGEYFYGGYLTIPKYN